MAESPAGANGLSKFPNLSQDHFEEDHSHTYNRRTSFGAGERDYSPKTRSVSNDRWRPRASSKSQWRPAASQPNDTTRHGRQKSLSEAFRTIRVRGGSMSQNAHEIAEALKAPVSPRLVGICCFWYAVSVVSNTSAGQILNTFPKPVTLTIIQFALVSFWCFVVSWLASMYPGLKTRIPALRMGIRPPSREIITATLPITGFMIAGHILTSDAMSRIPVSLVHTIKGLSPLITVLAYRFVFGIRYNWPTYASLVPLTVGVVTACSTKFSDNIIGLSSAFASAVLFVTQNIVSKRLFNDATQAEQEGFRKTHKPDKLNLLCYSSLLALGFTFPIWLWSEGFGIIGDIWRNGAITLSEKATALDHGRLVFEYLFCGTFHFGQSFVAFQLLSMVSPVTYSVASLIKRVAVICFALVWFGNPITRIQGFGIALTFLGLYLYDRTSDSKKAEQRKAKILGYQTAESNLLPLHEKLTDSPPPIDHNIPSPYANGFAFPPSADKKHDGVLPARNDSHGANGWLAPGTRAEETWNREDLQAQHRPVHVT